MIFTMMSTTVVHAQSVKDGSNEVTVTQMCIRDRYTRLRTAAVRYKITGRKPK